MWILCDRCIAAIKSRGENIFVGKRISQDIDYYEDKEQYDTDKSIQKCNWCEEPNEELYECI